MDPVRLNDYISPKEKKEILEALTLVRSNIFQTINAGNTSLAETILSKVKKPKDLYEAFIQRQKTWSEPMIETAKEVYFSDLDLSATLRELVLSNWDEYPG